MMNWKERYADKLRTPDEAVAVVKSGDFVRFTHNSTWQVCRALAAALARRASELEGVTIDTTFSGAADMGLLAPGTEHSWRIITGFAGVAEMAKLSQRDEQTNHKPFYMSLQHLVDGPFREEYRRSAVSSDVAMVMITPPDKNGIVTFGHHLWGARRAVRNAKIVIGEVSEELATIPGGDNWMPVDEFDYLVESPKRVAGSAAAVEIPDWEQAATEVICTVIAEEFINDGDCIMFGAGTVPGRMGPFLTNKADLGCHTEVIMPLELMRAGVINNKRRNLVPGKTSATGVGALTKEDIQFIDGNCTFELRDDERNNNPLYIAQNENMVAINSALEINLFSEINIERVGYRYMRGTGGQVEFIIGALYARNGRSIHGIISRKWSNRDQTWVSSIVPQFTYPGVASVPRQYADIVVTEYGVARLMGKTERQRANELIAIAHPDFRAELRKEAQKLFYQ